MTWGEGKLLSVIKDLCFLEALWEAEGRILEGMIIPAKREQPIPLTADESDDIAGR